MSVRTFAIALLLMLALAVPSYSAARTKTKRDDKASEKLGIKLSLQCWTFNRLSFFETVDKAAELGVKYLEIFPGQKLEPGSKISIHRTMSDDTIAKIKKKLADAGGLKLVAYGVDGLPTDEKNARKTFEWAKKMGLKVLVTETTPNDVHEKLCQEFNIKVALHNHPATWPPEAVLKACKNRDKRIGSCSDTGHWMRAKFVPAEMVRFLKGRVLHLHFKDLNQFGNGHDVAWGTGKGNPKAIIEELKNIGFKGYLSIEFEYGDLKHLAANLPKCVAFFDKTLTQIAK